MALAAFLNELGDPCDQGMRIVRLLATVVNEDAMWKVYADIGWRMLASMFTVLDGGLTLVGIALWAGAASPRFVAWVQNNTGVDSKWFWIPLAVVILHLFFKAMYERNKAWEQGLIDRFSQIAHATGASETEKFLARRNDLELIRGLLNEQADNAIYLLEPYDPQNAKQWAERVKMILDGNVKTEKAKSWPSLAEMDQPSQLATRITYLRSLTVGLRLDDLRR